MRFMFSLPGLVGQNDAPSRRIGHPCVPSARERGIVRLVGRKFRVAVTIERLPSFRRLARYFRLGRPIGAKGQGRPVAFRATTAAAPRAAATHPVFLRVFRVTACSASPLPARHR